MDSELNSENDGESAMSDERLVECMDSEPMHETMKHDMLNEDRLPDPWT